MPMSEYTEVRTTACHAGSDGECYWKGCPQLRHYDRNGCPLWNQRVAPWSPEESADAE